MSCLIVEFNAKFCQCDPRERPSSYGLTLTSFPIFRQLKTGIACAHITFPLIDTNLIASVRSGSAFVHIRANTVGHQTKSWTALTLVAANRV